MPNQLPSIHHVQDEYVVKVLNSVSGRKRIPPPKRVGVPVYGTPGIILQTSVVSVMNVDDLSCKVPVLGCFTLPTVYGAFEGA